MNRFEQLIEYVINDEEQKARELFHDIVVEKSREIYENIMAEEEIDEAADEELEEADEGDLEEGAMGGDAADNLIDDVEMEEESDMNMEADGDDDMGSNDMGGDDDMGDGDVADMGDGMGGSDEAATKDDIMNLEDKLDQLMAEFEELMSGDAGGDDMAGDGDGFDADAGGDAIAVDDTEEMMPMAEAISLKAAPKPVTAEEGGVNKKSTVAANSGAAGMASKPVHTGTAMGGKHDAAGAYSNQTKDLIGDFQNKAGAGMKDLKPANKPHLAQAAGVNTKSPLPGGRKG
jgi:hypothetical protein